MNLSSVREAETQSSESLMSPKETKQENERK